MKMNSKHILALFMAVVILCSVVSPVISVAEGTDIGINKTLISKSDYDVVTGVTESHIVTQNNDGSNQVRSYVLEVDLNNPDVGIIVGYKNYMDNLTAVPSWGVQTVSAQAAAAENYYKNIKKMSTFEIVGGVNGDFFSLPAGNPNGYVVMNGITYNATYEEDFDAYFAILNDGTAIIDSGEFPANAKEVISGHYVLLEDGKINPELYDYELKHPRTSVGIKADGTVVLVAADGRQEPDSCGQTLVENAQQMLSLGCVDAIHLDGGGSTTLVSQHEGEKKLSVRNSPAEGKERAVGSTLLVYSTAVSDYASDSNACDRCGEVHDNFIQEIICFFRDLFNRIIKLFTGGN